MYSSSVSVSNRLRRIFLSKHAAKRSQQRGIGPDSAQLIKTFGERSHDGNGAVRYVMNDRAMKRLVLILGRNQRIDALSGAYIVVDAANESLVITIGHRWN